MRAIPSLEELERQWALEDLTEQAEPLYHQVVPEDVFMTSACVIAEARAAGDTPADAIEAITFLQAHRGHIFEGVSCAFNGLPLTRPAGCRKHPHDSKGAAEAQARSIKRRGLQRNNRIHAYRCPDCGRYHVGHASK